MDQGEEDQVEDEETRVEDEESILPEGVRYFLVEDPDVFGDDEMNRHEGEHDMAEVLERRDLKAISSSKEHWLTHVPKSPYCQSCQEARMKQAYSKRGAFARETSKFGGIVTCDHMYSARAQMRGFHSEKNALTVKDVHTGMIFAYPVENKSQEHMIDALKHFAGRMRILNVYSDNVPELIGVMELSLMHETSAPVVLRNNSRIERSNQVINGGTTSSLVQAGPPLVTGRLPHSAFASITMLPNSVSQHLGCRPMRASSQDPLFRSVVPIQSLTVPPRSGRCEGGPAREGRHIRWIQIDQHHRMVG